MGTKSEGESQVRILANQVAAQSDCKLDTAAQKAVLVRILCGVVVNTLPSIYDEMWAKGWPPDLGSGHQVSSILTISTKFARVVHRLERYTDNVEVEGSIPSSRTKIVDGSYNGYYARFTPWLSEFESLAVYQVCTWCL